MSGQAVCPSCGVIFGELPTRKRKCPDCGEPFFNRNNPDDLNRRLMTKEEAYQADLNWKSHRKRIQYNNITEINKTILKTSDHHERKMLFHKLAREHLTLGKRGQVQAALKSCATEELLYYLEDKHPEANYVKITSCSKKNGACSKCLEQEGGILTFREASEKMPIPHTSCEAINGFCRCYYTLVFDDELPKDIKNQNNNLLTKLPPSKVKRMPIKKEKKPYDSPLERMIIPILRVIMWCFIGLVAIIATVVVLLLIIIALQNI